MKSLNSKLFEKSQIKKNELNHATGGREIVSQVESGPSGEYRGDFIKTMSDGSTQVAYW